jgi:hypothetical protein
VLKLNLCDADEDTLWCRNKGAKRIRENKREKKATRKGRGKGREYEREKGREYSNIKFQ